MKNKVIAVRGAQVHNLKNIDVDIPRNKLTVVTGLSGSGKSSLAFNTIYAEGQRRFVESLSSYARQFLERLEKPNVESIDGIPPAVAIQQNSPSKNARSTVGTSTEIYDYLRLIWGRIGKTYCKISGKQVRKDTPQSVADEIAKWDEGEKFYVLFKLPDNVENVNREIVNHRNNGYFRIMLKNEKDILDTSEDSSDEVPLSLKPSDFFFLADRLKVVKNKEFISRLTETLEHSFMNGHGRIEIYRLNDEKFFKFSNKYEDSESGREYVEPEPRLFSFNNPFGACPKCQGFGRSVGIDEDLVVPNRSLSIKKGAIHPFNSDRFGKNLETLIELGKAGLIRCDIPFADLSEDELSIVWNGVYPYQGIFPFFKDIEEYSHSVQNRVFLSKYKTFTKCPECNGSRLRTSARQVFVHGKNIPEIVKMPLDKLYDWLSNVKFTEYELGIISQVLEEVLWRLSLLIDIGLTYLNLDRISHTLSGGESQRISLSSALGSSLVGTLYVLDEPSIGLHPRDSDRLIKILHRLRNIGNTIIVVEHDPDIMISADYIIDMGPLAGSKGGEVVYQGDFEGIYKSDKSLTGLYLSKKKNIPTRNKVKVDLKKAITISGVRHNNLKIDSVDIPTGVITVVTGVSGSGKSSLISDIFYPAMQQELGFNNNEIIRYDKLKNADLVAEVEMVDQSSIGKSSRSTPVTYTKTFDGIRELFANTQLGKQLNLTPGYFSFNVPGGRCEKCEGEGYVTVDMQFLSDVSLVCEDCNGTRYKREARQVTYNGKSIVDVLDMTIEEATEFFKDSKKIFNKMNILNEVGLGYLKLGQPSTMLSGGEAQRIKLANHLDNNSDKKKLFIFDEPTTGLHLEDISKLLNCFNRLVSDGHTVIIIEHNLHIMYNADYIIDLGPDAGDKGGLIVDSGTPEEIAERKKSFTGIALDDFIKKL
jgi:excinuclease ABC subunit A